MNLFKWFCPCSSDDERGNEPRRATRPRDSQRVRHGAAPLIEPYMEETPYLPPPYSLFDPHPEDCLCAIHIHKPRPLRPIIVEAFQSEGCNSCPPTNTLLLSILTQADPNILVLDYHVTYWDHLGRKDPFGFPSADKYQQEYAQASGMSRLFTPKSSLMGLLVAQQIQQRNSKT